MSETDKKSGAKKSASTAKPKGGAVKAKAADDAVLAEEKITPAAKPAAKKTTLKTDGAASGAKKYTTKANSYNTAAKKTSSPKASGEGKSTPKKASTPRKKKEELPAVEEKEINLAEQTAMLVDEKLTQSDEDLSVEKIEKKPSFFDKFRSFFKKKRIIPSALSQVERYSPQLKQGLSAAQVEQRKSEQLINDTDTKYSKSYKSIFIGNIFTFFNLLCFATAGALIFAGADIMQLFFVVVFSANILIGIIQEIRAKISIEKLSLLSSPTAKVIRDGIETDIPIKEIVLDDVIILTTGKQVPTDCILAEGYIEVNESLLTGESVPVKKEIGDILFAGSFISSGTCKVRAEKVGKLNYIQTLTSKAKKYKKPNSELLNSLRTIMVVIGILIIPIAALMFATNYKIIGEINETIMRTGAVIIGMIPAGMFLLTSMALAVGVLRLARNNTLVQDLYSLEMLARVDVLCLDKTGTITDGRMKVNDLMLLSNNTNYTINEIVGAMLLALDDNNQTSIALYNHFGHSNLLKPIKMIPFSSKRKLSAVTFADVGTFVMGAPEFVMETLPDKVDKMVNQYAAMGLRVLLIAHSNAQINGDKIPASLKPMSLITIADNIREDAIATIKWFKENDVAVKVISGDNPITVSEVARRAGVENADKYISLEGLNDKEIISVASKYSVFGRVTPEQKAVLVKALKAAGHTVAMTGDGVNDILALKEADCSISVASGSEAARNVSHLVLMDNNFSSMPKVVYEGRRVINNIQKSSSLYLMKTLFTTVFALISIISATAYPFTTKNMFLLETFIIGVPSFALSLQPNSSRVSGKFISYVLSRAIPSAFILIINVWVYKGLKFVLPEFNEDLYYQTLATLGLTFSGVVLLYRISQPFNAFRGFMVAAMAVVIILFISFLGSTNMLGLQKLPWQYIVLLICFIQFDFPLSKFLFDIFDRIRGAENKKTVKNT